MIEQVTELKNDKSSN